MNSVILYYGGYYGGMRGLNIGGDFYYVIAMLVMLVVSLIAQGKVKGNYNKYSRVANSAMRSGAQVAREILDANGLQHIDVVEVAGELTDHYDPSKQIVSLSSGVYNGCSISAMSIAAHECGHAIQHAKHYAPVLIRSSLVPVVNFSSRFSWWLIMGGLLISSLADTSTNLGYILAVIGVILFAGAFLFQLVTLPVELNASNRAMNVIEGMYAPAGEEKKGMRKVLSAAAFTYVAAMLTSLISLLRVISMVSRSRRR